MTIVLFLGLEPEESSLGCKFKPHSWQKGLVFQKDRKRDGPASLLGT